MKQQNIFFVGLLILLIIIGFGFILYQSQPKTATNEDIVMTKNKEAGIGGQESGGKILAGKSSPYIEFKKGEYDEALKSGKIIFLDFYANWCPICRGEAPEIQSGFDSLTSDKVIGFRVNYNDTETDDDEKKLLVLTKKSKHLRSLISFCKNSLNISFFRTEKAFTYFIFLF